ncbi:hypothetical protein CDD83_7165 [Cordyceps sp. RAO-2017]|nr:hypothetical protein CDD83_7165 [Cordyceps sp. RAO-2017]
MKFTAQVALVCLAAGAYAGPVIQRNLSTIKQELVKIQDGIDKLDQAAKNVKGNPGVVIASADALIHTIVTSTATVQGTSPVTIEDAVKLLGPVQDLVKHGKTLHQDFVNERSDIAKAGQCKTTREKIGSIKDEASKCIDVIVSKVEEKARSIARNEANKVIQELNEAVADFGPDKCRDA